MKTRHLPVLLLVLTCPQLLAAQPRYIRDGNETRAAVVPLSAALLHTEQILTADDDAAALLRAAKHVVAQNGGDQDRIAKVNIVASTQAVADEARRALDHVRVGAPVSYVAGALPQGKTLGIDVVAPAHGDAVASTPDARTLRAGPRLYVSGQAERGATPAEATAATIASLIKTLESLGSSRKEVVQAKCFLTPMSASADVSAEFDKAFRGSRPPLVFVEWKSDLPIEIELIAAAPPAGGDVPAIQYLTPPGMKASPLFARVVRINRGDVVYTAGLYAGKPGSGEEQVLSIFDQLQRVLKETGGDLAHLVKATYYVSDDDASKQLNVLRPKFYDPQRPPAASKATVPGVGMKDRSIAIDMIGVVVDQSSTTHPIKP